jgi:hypothetical protein
MKPNTRFLTVFTTAALLAGATGWADDPAFQNRMALQRQQTERNQPTTTIGVYARGKGVAGTKKELRVKEHTMPHGAAHYLLVPAK